MEERYRTTSNREVNGVHRMKSTYACVIDVKKASTRLVNNGVLNHAEAVRRRSCARIKNDQHGLLQCGQCPRQAGSCVTSAQSLSCSKLLLHVRWQPGEPQILQKCPPTARCKACKCCCLYRHLPPSEPTLTRCQNVLRCCIGNL